MSTIRHVSKSQPCPICGKPDWCGNYIRQDGKGIRHVCMRAAAHDVIGQDGLNYVYVMETENSALIFFVLQVAISFCICFVNPAWKFNVWLFFSILILLIKLNKFFFAIVAFVKKMS